MGNVAVIGSSEAAIRLHRAPLCHHQCYCEQQFPKILHSGCKAGEEKKKKRERTAERVGQSQHFFITSSEHETDTSNVLFGSLSSDSLNKGARPPRLFHLKQHVQKNTHLRIWHPMLASPAHSRRPAPYLQQQRYLIYRERKILLSQEY